MATSSVIFLTVITACLGLIAYSLPLPAQYTEGSSMTGKMNKTNTPTTSSSYVTTEENFEPTSDTENKTTPTMHHAHYDVRRPEPDHVFRRLLADILKLTRSPKQTLLQIASPSNCNLSESTLSTTASRTVEITASRNAITDHLRATTESRDGDRWAWLILGGKTNSSIRFSSVRSLLTKLQPAPFVTYKPTPISVT
ncbi:uncharacterized protein LOC121428311 [Lytechinus variegatus]|uniref:uncharacterized protein LOC121428311 n=1 Tax=Lytechinus variegatus TaxID=7654 RepID=UPI001BB26B59|nr:uncharacterized protein LOC121428311 [Lytechinus variegatus]